MHPINTFVGQDLSWVRLSSDRRAYELRVGEEVIATLRWQKGSLAEAAAAEDHWTFKRADFWHPRVTVRTPGSDADLAIFHANWAGGGLLELPQGRRLRWGAANFWRSEWAWQDADGSPLVRFSGGQRHTSVEGHVELAPASAALPDLALLVLLGWYLLLLHARDESDSTGAIVAVIGSST